MITLKNISTGETLKELTPEFIDFMTQANGGMLLDFEELYDYVVENEITDEMVTIQLEKAIQLMEELNQRGVEPISFETYRAFGRKIQGLNYFDSIMSVTELPLIQASNRNNQIYNAIKAYDIQMLKFYLTHVGGDGKPLLLTDYNMRPTNLKRLIRMVHFYDEHIVRLLQENPCFSLQSNYLFYKDYAEKQLLIWNDDAYRNAIVEYLFEHGDHYIFGPLLDSQKEKILEDMKDVAEKIKEGNYSTINPYYFYDDFCFYNPIKLKRSISQQLLDIVTKYITREEFKGDIVKTRVLDRFIVED